MSSRTRSEAASPSRSAMVTFCHGLISRWAQIAYQLGKHSRWPCDEGINGFLLHCNNTGHERSGYYGKYDIGSQEHNCAGLAQAQVQAPAPTGCTGRCLFLLYISYTCLVQKGQLPYLFGSAMASRLAVSLSVSVSLFTLAIGSFASLPIPTI